VRDNFNVKFLWDRYINHSILRGRPLSNIKKILIPQLVHRNHWILIFLDLESKIIYYIDTLQDPKTSYSSENATPMVTDLFVPAPDKFLGDCDPLKLMNVCFRLLTDVFDASNLTLDKSDWKYWVVPHPVVFRQKDAFNCGILMLNYAQLIVTNQQWHRKTFAPQTLEKIRKDIFQRFFKSGTPWKPVTTSSSKSTKY